MKHVVLLAFAAAGVLSAQSYQQVYLNQSVAPVVSSPVSHGSLNQFHQLTVITSSVPTHTCTSWTGSVGLEGSPDQIHWTSIGPFITAVPAVAVPEFSTATGAFSYVRVNFSVNGDTTNCALTIYYSGTSSGQASGTSPTLLVLDTVSVATAQTGNDPVQVGSSCKPPHVPVVYSLALSNVGAMATTLTLAAVDDTGMVTVNLWRVTVAAGAQYTMANSERALFTPGAPDLSGSQTFSLFLTASVASTTWIHAAMRCE